MSNRDDFGFQMLDWTKYTRMKSKANHQKAIQHFKQLGEFEDGMVLHHIDFTMIYFDPDRYVEWRIEDLLPMTKSQHVKLHLDFARRSRLGLFDDVWMARCKNLSWVRGC